MVLRDRRDGVVVRRAALVRERTPDHATLAINTFLFAKLHVRYDTTQQLSPMFGPVRAYGAARA
eukprot:7062142-Prymnesium_polylepis.1